MKRTQAAQRAESPSTGPGAEEVVIRPLGAGQEVGRSCFVLRYQGKGVMFDCGIHPAHTGHGSLPLLDDDDLSTLNVALITHFHLDHSAAVPFLAASTPFRGHIFMTHATKSIFYTMMKDMLRMQKRDPSRQLFTAEQLEKAMSQISVINFHQTLEVDGIQITPYRAGHVLGAAMFMVEIQGMRCLYTGDYSRVPDRHMPAADLPAPSPHIIIVESTFGVSNHLPREDRERGFQRKVRDIVAGRGHCLIPVVALGRAQELLLILEDCWRRHPELHDVPIHQTSGLAAQSLGVYQAYIEMMNDSMRAAFRQRNPFDFKFVRHTRGFRAESELGPCVVLATPSMLQSGLSRELFEAWCEDRRNGIVIADFAVQGTLAAELLTNPREVLAADGRVLKVRSSISAFSFSAHADYSQTSGFLEALAPAHVVLCHGNVTEMERLQKALVKQAATANVKREIHTPRNLSEVRIPFTPRRTVYVVGEAAEQPPKRGARIQGVLVHRSKHGEPSVMAPSDLGHYTKVSTGTVTQRQTMRLLTDFGKCRLALEVTFEGIDARQDFGGIESLTADVEGATSLYIADQVLLMHLPPDGSDDADRFGRVVLEWQSSPTADCTADAIIAVLLQEQGKPVAIGAAEEERKRAMAEGDEEAVQAAEKSMAIELLKAQFGSAALDPKTQHIVVSIPSSQVVVDWDGDKVTCHPADPPLHSRISSCLERLRAALERIQPASSSQQDTASAL